jgi:hypothetical protein
MPRLSDFFVRDAKDTLLKRLKKIFENYARLDDNQWILKKTQNEIKKVLKDYRGRLAVITDFFSGSKFDPVAKHATDDFINALSSFPEFEDIKVGQTNIDRMLGSIQGEYTAAMSGTLDTIIENLATKFSRYKLMADAEKIPAAILKTITDRRDIVSIGGVDYSGKSLNELWNVLTSRYGQRDTVIFTSGKKIPLNTYVDGKSISMATDINTTVNMTESARRGIATMKISSHGSPDSCNLWEGKIVFTTVEARNQFLKQYPEIKQAESWKVLTIIKNPTFDKSHIFKFNCRHMATPYPVQFLDEKEIKQLPKSPPIQRTNREARLNAEKINKERGKIPTIKAPTVDLTGRIDNLSVGVPQNKSKLQKKANAITDKRWLEGLTEDERKNLKRYTDSAAFYGEVNSKLRTGKDRLGNVFSKADSKFLNKGTKDITKALDRASLSQDTVVYRRFGDHSSKLKGLKVGDSFIDKGFSSTSLDLDLGNKEFFQAEIFIKKGSNAAYIEDISAIKAERELLLQRNTKFKVIGKRNVIIGGNNVTLLQLEAILK